MIRPQEVLPAVQALAQAYNDYFGTVADYNRAQFRLSRALGQPAQALAEDVAPCQEPAVDSDPPGVTLGQPRPAS